MVITSVFANYPVQYPTLLLINAIILESYVPDLSMQWYGEGGWSVSTEFFFYLLFPVIMPLLLRITTKHYVLLLLAMMLLISSLPGAYFTTHQYIRYELTYAFAPSRLPEFICGMLLGQLVLYHGFQLSERIAIGLLFLTNIYLATFGPHVAGYTVHNIVVLPSVLALICVLINAKNTRFFKWVDSGVMRYLGKISFSFYIVQIPLMLIIDELIIKGLVHKYDSFLIVPLFLLNILIAVASYELIEKKMHYMILINFLKKHVVVT